MSSFEPLLSVGAVLLAIFGSLSLLTKRMRMAKTGTCAGCDRIALTDHHTVQVVEIGGVRLVVGTGPSGAPAVLAKLGEVPDPKDDPKDDDLDAAREHGSERSLGRMLERLGVVRGR